MWTGLSVTGGVVRTREAQALEPGEYRQITNARLKPGDSTQLHNDVGSQAFGTTANPIVAGPFYLAFEGSDDKILCVTSDGSSSSYLETATAGTSGTFSSIQTISGVVTAADVVHYGDQYFVGTDQGNYVVQDNASRVMGLNGGSGVFSTASLNNLVSGASNSVEQNDRFVYWFTEYDSVNDIESEVINGDSGTASADGDEFRVFWGLTKTNSTADKVRIYRAYTGNGALGTSDAWSNQYSYNIAPGETIGSERLDLVGSLVAELDFDYTDATHGQGYWVDKVLSKYNTGTFYPLVQTDVVFGGSIYRALTKTRNFTLGSVFNDSLIVNDPSTSAQILRYASPGQFEYQPDPYFFALTSERSDDIVGLYEVNNRLLALTTSGAHRISYLPTAGDLVAEQGRVTEVVTTLSGCVGRNASAKLSLRQGEIVVWVSERGLEWSTGNGWADACPDFTSADIDTSDVVLVNNTKLYRLELYSAGQRWDFYYHSSLLKDDALKLMGPSTAPASALTGACRNETYVWLGASSTVYTVGVGNSATDTTVTTGHLRGPQPLTDLEVRRIAMAHSGTSGTTHKIRVYGKQLGVAEAQTPQYTMPNGDQSEIGKVDLAMNGKHLRLEIVIGGSGAWSAGPVWMDIHPTEGE